MCEYGSVNSRGKSGLTTDDLESLATALAAGKRVTVYLRDPMPSLDLPAGASARVVSVDGSTVTVSPKGVDDQLPFEADELQKTRATATSTAPARPRPVKATSAPSVATRSPRTVATESKPEPEPAKSRPVEQKSSPPRAPRRTKTSTAAVSVTVTSVGESTWTVSVSHGSKKQGKPTEVTSDRVARAMHALGDDAAITAVDAVIESARAAAQKRIEELSHELEAARAVLAHLDVQDPD
ncbi:UNVERIFIED_CONTAM: hypothetical protein DES50_102558 [Williamsia faeni]